MLCMVAPVRGVGVGCLLCVCVCGSFFSFFFLGGRAANPGEEKGMVPTVRGGVMVAPVCLCVGGGDEGGGGA